MSPDSAGWRGGVRGRVRGLAGGEVVATASSPPVNSRGSLGFISGEADTGPTLTDKEEGAASGETNEDLIAVTVAGTLSGDFSGGCGRPGDLRLAGDFSLGSRLSAEAGPGPYLVGDTIFSLASSGLAWPGLSGGPGAAGGSWPRPLPGSRTGEIW